jgi:hypothetical protein
MVAAWSQDDVLWEVIAVDWSNVEQAEAGE